MMMCDATACNFRPTLDYGFYNPVHYAQPYYWDYSHIQDYSAYKYTLPAPVFINRKIERNSEKRKEKSRDAARSRRGKESEIFSEMSSLMPLPAKTAQHLDKASLMRIAISWLKMRHLVEKLELPLVKEEMVSEEDYLKALDGFLLILSPEGDIMFLSENIAKYLGLSQVDMTGQSIYDYSHPCDHSELNGLFAAKKTDREPCSLFLRIKNTLTSKGRNVNLKSATWKVVHCLGRFVTVEESKKESCLVLSCQLIPHPSSIDTLLGSQTFVSRHGLDMKFSYVDDRVFDILGYEACELTDRSMYELQHALDSEQLSHSFKNLFSKSQVTTGKYRLLTKCGGYVWVQTQATVVANQRTHKPQFVVCVNYVLSGMEEKDTILSLEQQLARNEEKYHQVLFSTDTVFSPVTNKDINQGYVGVEHNGSLTVVKEEPEDLTHLAPQAGDVCIPLSFPASGVFDQQKINIYDDILFPTKSYEAVFPEMMVGGDTSYRTKKSNCNSIKSPASPVDHSDGSRHSSIGETDQSSSLDMDMIDKLCTMDTSWETGIIADKTSDKDSDSVEELEMRAPYIPMGMTDDMYLPGTKSRLYIPGKTTTNKQRQDSKSLQSCYTYAAKNRPQGGRTGVRSPGSPNRQPVVQLSSSLTKLLQNGNLTQNTASHITDHHYAGMKRPVDTDTNQGPKRQRGNLDVQSMIHKDLKALIGRGNTHCLENSVLKNLLLKGEDINSGYVHSQSSPDKTADKTPKPRSRLIPALNALSQYDCEVNAPISQSSNLLHGHKLLNALDE